MKTENTHYFWITPDGKLVPFGLGKSYCGKFFDSIEVSEQTDRIFAGMMNGYVFVSMEYDEMLNLVFFEAHFAGYLTAEQFEITAELNGIHGFSVTWDKFLPQDSVWMCSDVYLTPEELAKNNYKNVVDYWFQAKEHLSKQTA